MAGVPDIDASAVPPPELCVLRCLLERRAGDRPDHDFVRFRRGGTRSHAETFDRIRR